MSISFGLIDSIPRLLQIQPEFWNNVEGQSLFDGKRYSAILCIAYPFFSLYERCHIKVNKDMDKWISRSVGRALGFIQNAI